MRRKVLTGGAGITGSHRTDALLDERHWVHVPERADRLVRRAAREQVDGEPASRGLAA
ncbi:MAG TPA: hypothetical protein VK929_13360 [Longimicrobiales bacterium]|nr:hypothetical protein [Longimicrobiales bacterium]